MSTLNWNWGCYYRRIANLHHKFKRVLDVDKTFFQKSVFNQGTRTNATRKPKKLKNSFYLHIL